MPLGNHQATDKKRDEITTVVLKSSNPYLPDRVEFRHQFVKSKAGRGIDIKKNVLTPSIIHWWRGGYGFYHTQGEFPDMWAHSEYLGPDIDTAFFVSKHYDGFFCETKVTIFCTC